MGDLNSASDSIKTLLAALKLYGPIHHPALIDHVAAFLFSPKEGRAFLIRISQRRSEREFAPVLRSVDYDSEYANLLAPCIKELPKEMVLVYRAGSWEYSTRWEELLLR